MKTKIAILLLSIVMKACLQSETHSGDAKTKQEPAKLLVKITYPEDELSQKSFVYDNSGRLIKFNSISDTAYYSYTKGLINRKWIEANGQTIAEQTFVLGADRRIVSSTYSESTIGKVYETAYQYSADGYLVKAITKNFTTRKLNTTEYTYKDGNLIETRYLNDGKLYTGLLYTYNTSQTNKIALNVFTSVDEFFTNNSLGKPSKNVLTQSVSKSANGDTLSYLKYKNEFDKEGYLIKTTEQDMLNELSIEKLYEYKTSTLL